MSPPPPFSGPAEPEQLLALFDGLVEAMVIADEHGLIERFNRAAENMFGYTADEAIGRNLTLLMPPPDRDLHDGYMSRYQATRVRKIIGIGREVKAQHRDGTVFYVDLAIAEVRYQQTVRYVGIMRDVTERKLAEEQAMRRRDEMIRVSRLTTMGEMAAAMAHELNQPLTAIANYANACRRLLAAGDSTEIDAALEKISGQAQRAGQVIQRMRSFVKFDDSRRHPLFLSEVIQEIQPLAELDAKANNIRLEIGGFDGLPEVVADPVQLQQVLLNLIRNGIDAMPETLPASRRLCVTGEAGENDEVRVHVADNGTGVPAEVASRLFEPFFTTKATGMGLGLAISRTIVEGHGGHLGCSTNPAGGATFTFTLPTRIA